MSRTEVKEFLNDSIETTTQLLNDILEFTRGTTRVDPVTGSWSQLISRRLELVRLDLQKQQVEPAIEADDDLNLYPDADRIFRVIRNLYKNAGEALQQAGRTDGRVTVGASRQNGVTRVWVADNGTGLPPEVQDKLFQPFATKGKVGGTGFGLAIARQLVEAHHGTIDVDSGPSGTTFTISIPNGEHAD
ncbi:MAG: HAMP domain-containing sensor histidine kinase [Fuerstiella sp.]